VVDVPECRTPSGLKSLWEAAGTLRHWLVLQGTSLRGTLIDQIALLSTLMHNAARFADPQRMSAKGVWHIKRRFAGNLIRGFASS